MSTAHATGRNLRLRPDGDLAAHLGQRATGPRDNVRQVTETGCRSVTQKDDGQACSASMRSIVQDEHWEWESEKETGERGKRDSLQNLNCRKSEPYSGRTGRCGGGWS